MRGRRLAVGLGIALLLFSCQGREAATSGGSAADTEAVAQLEALGYVEWVEEEDDLSRSGVLHRDPRATEGLTLYKSRPAPEAHLVDLDGRVVHTWRAPPLDVTDWRSLVSRVYRRGSKMSWDHVEVQPGGDLLGIVKDRHIERISWDSQLVWRARIPAHHDLDVMPDGRVLTLTQRMTEIETGSGPLAIVDNGIAVLSPDGQLVREISLASILADRIPSERVASIRAGESGESDASAKKLLGLRDVFHANSIELLRHDVPGLGKAGDALISIRELDLVAVLDLERLTLGWEWGPGELQRQHHPSLLPNGNVLIYDNGASRGWTRIAEVEPATGEVVWQYTAAPPEAFFSETRGSVQWLPGDRFLVADSNSGRAFEIDRQGRVLWEFFNPDIDPFKRKRGSFYRIERLTPERVATLPLSDMDTPDVAAASGSRTAAAR